MARTTSIRLFTGYRLLSRWFEMLDVQLQMACDRHLLVGEPLPIAELPDKLRREFMLRTLELPGIVDATVNVHPCLVADADGSRSRLFRASARISYTGSRLLLRTAPEQGFAFPYKGRIGAKSLHLDALLPSMDPTDFVTDASVHMGRVQRALSRSQAALAQWNEQIEAAIKRKLRTY